MPTHQEDYEGLKPLDLAKDNRHDECMQLLFKTISPTLLVRTRPPYNHYLTTIFVQHYHIVNRFVYITITSTITHLNSLKSLSCLLGRHVIFLECGGCQEFPLFTKY